MINLKNPTCFRAKVLEHQVSYMEMSTDFHEGIPMAEVLA